MEIKLGRFKEFLKESKNKFTTVDIKDYTGKVTAYEVSKSDFAKFLKSASFNEEEAFDDFLSCLTKTVGAGDSAHFIDIRDLAGSIEKLNINPWEFEE